jgi:hypothetical protein
MEIIGALAQDAYDAPIAIVIVSVTLQPAMKHASSYRLLELRRVPLVFPWLIQLRADSGNRRTVRYRRPRVDQDPYARSITSPDHAIWLTEQALAPRVCILVKIAQALSKT